MREYSKLICPKTQLELCFRANQLTQWPGKVSTSWPAVLRTNHQATGPFILFMKSYFDHFLFLSFTLTGTTQNAKYKSTKESKHQQYIIFTPWNVSVSSKHVLSCFYDSDCVRFPITPVVESTDRPTVSRGTVTQQPLRMTSSRRFQKLM